MRSEFRALRAAFPGAKEFKWTNVHGGTPYRAYVDLVTLFFQGPAAPHLSFKCLVVHRSDDPSRPHDKAARDIGFYKAYHTLLKYRLEPNGVYRIRLDQRSGPRPNPEQGLAAALSGSLSGRNIEIRSCDSICSKTDDLMQLADLLCGAVGWAWNGKQGTSGAKIALAQQIESHIAGRDLRQETAGSAVKFNVWRYRPKKK